MKRLFFLGIFFVSICSFTFAQAEYPVPQKTDKMLFYLQRSHNRNTIVYDLNTLPNGQVNDKSPVAIYWIRYEEGGRKADLSLIQSSAFGLSSELIDKQKESFMLHFNKFRQRDVFLIKSASGHYKAFVKINNELAELDSVFIKSENNSLGIPLSFQYIEFTGVSLTSRKKITERIEL
jgi:hypothetical protein